MRQTRLSVAVLFGATLSLTALLNWEVLCGAGSWVANAADREGAAGTIRVVSWDEFAIDLTSGRRRISAKGRDGSCTVPAGQYDAFALTLVKPDRKGTAWQLRSARQRQPVHVRAGETVSIRVEPPFTATVRASRVRAAPGEVIRFAFELADARGMAFTAPQSAPSPPVPPQLTLSDETGRQIGKYDFEFG